jgi:hypothetical protein
MPFFLPKNGRLPIKAIPIMKKYIYLIAILSLSCERPEPETQQKIDLNQLELQFKRKEDRVWINDFTMTAWGKWQNTDNEDDILNIDLATTKPYSDRLPDLNFTITKSNGEKLECKSIIGKYGYRNTFYEKDGVKVIIQIDENNILHLRPIGKSVADLTFIKIQ